MSDDTNVYDVFYGSDEHDAVWQCSVDSLNRARQRMDEIAKKKPGAYFIYYLPERTVIARIDTARKDQLA